MKPITGPADVKIGDTVSLTTVNSYGTVGTVTKVGDDGMTIRTEDGRKRTAKYSRPRSGYVGINQPRDVQQFSLLDARDLWQRKRPPIPMLVDYANGKRDMFKAAAHDLAARTALHAEVDALADWYAGEPEGES